MNTNMVIQKDSYTSIEDALLFSKISEKYSTSVTGVQINGGRLPDVKTYIKETYPEASAIQFPISPAHDTWVFEHDDFMLVCESVNSKKQYIFDLYAIDYETQKIFYDLLKSFEDRSNELFIGISSFFLSQNSLQDNYLTKQISDFEKLSSNYYPYLDVHEMFNQFIISEDNMLVLTGLPGTGKTKMIDMFLNYMLTSSLIKDKINLEKEKEKKRALMNSDKTHNMSEDELSDMVEVRINTMYDNDEIPVAYVKNEQILATDEFWNRLRSGGFKLVILDDLDYGLLPRTQQVGSSEDVAKNAFISQLLSYTDGIFEEGNNTKFIITTNRDVKEIDTAVLRKGRTFDILNLRYLTNVEAKNIWIDYGLNVETFNEEFGTSHEIPASDVGAIAKDMLMALKLNIERKPYVLEDGISQYKTLKTTKKIGML